MLSSGGGLDIRTLFISQNLILTTASLILFLSWRLHGKKFQGLGLWAVGTTLQTLGFLLIAFRGAVPDFLSIVAANASFLFGLAAINTGIEYFFASKNKRFYPYAISAAASLSLAFNTYCLPSLTARIVEAASTSGILLIICIASVLSSERERLGSTLLPIYSFAFLALASLLRVPIVLLYPPGDDFMTAGNLHGLVITANIVGITAGIAGMIMLISQRLQQEQIELAQTNRMLIQEMHHRIKNNLAALRGLIDLQALFSESPELKQALRKSCHRIDAIAKVHDLLHKNENIEKASLRTYIENLANTLGENFYAAEVRYNFDLEDVELSIASLLPLGLILNELITNSYEHAFPQGKGGVLNIAFKKHEEAFLLTVSDNGKGLPADFNQKERTSLGMKIVESLVRQLRGSLAVVAEPHASFRLVFPAETSGDEIFPIKRGGNEQENV